MHEPRLVEVLEEARRLGFLGPGPVDAHIDHAGAFLTALEGTTGTVVDLGSGGGVPGLVVAVARPDLRLVLVEARAKRCRFLEEASAALSTDAEVVEGRAEVVGRSALRGSADGRRRQELRPSGDHGGVRQPPAAGRWAAGGERAASACAAGPLAGRRPPPPRPGGRGAGGRGHHGPGARAAGPVPGHLPAPRRTARPSARSSEGPRVFHVEHRRHESLEPTSRVSRETSRTVLAPHRPTGQDAAVTESQDDLASRGRAIFQRLRGAGSLPTSEEPGFPRRTLRGHRTTQPRPAMPGQRRPAKGSSATRSSRPSPRPHRRIDPTRSTRWRRGRCPASRTCRPRSRAAEVPEDRAADLRAAGGIRGRRRCRRRSGDRRRRTRCPRSPDRSPASWRWPTRRAGWGRPPPP